MQLLRNISWWLIGNFLLISFVLVIVLSDLLAGQFSQLPNSLMVTTIVFFALGLFTQNSLFALGETLIHEIGHAQMAALTLGKVRFIRVERDASGVTVHQHSRIFNRFASILVSLAGPLASPVLLLLSARFISSELVRYWALALVVIISLILITTVRSFWGWATGLILLGVLYLFLEAVGFIDLLILTPQNGAIFKTYFEHIVLGYMAFNSGIALRYSWGNRKSVNPNSDEFKFAQAAFLPPRLGGYLILLLHFPLIWLASSFLLGWPSPLLGVI